MDRLTHESTRRAMAFADSYILKGNEKQRVRLLGNAVTPPVMRWIVERILRTLA